MKNLPMFGGVERVDSDSAELPLEVVDQDRPMATYVGPDALGGLTRGISVEVLSRPRATRPGQVYVRPCPGFTILVDQTDLEYP